MPLSPKGVEMAAIVSSSRDDFFLLSEKVFLFKWLDAISFRLGGDYPNSLPFTIPKALRLEEGVFFQGDMNDPTIMGTKRTYGNSSSCSFRILPQPGCHYFQGIVSSFFIISNV